MPVITKKGQVTLPKKIREELGVKEGDEVIFELKGKAIKLRKIERKSLLSLGGIAKGRALGKGDERAYVKKAIAKKIVAEGDSAE